MSCSCRLIGFAFRGRQNRWHEVRETLANARAGLCYKMAFRRDRPRHRIRHFHLLWPLLVIRQPCSDAAIRAKNVGRR
jgi:hypothetical protein